MSIVTGHTSRSIGHSLPPRNPLFFVLRYVVAALSRLTVTQFNDGARKSNPSTVDG